MNPYVGAALILGGAFLYLRTRPAGGTVPAQNLGNGNQPQQFAIPFNANLLPGEANNGFMNPPAAPAAWNPGGGTGGQYAPVAGSPLERFPMTPIDTPNPSQVATPVAPPEVAPIPFGSPDEQVRIMPERGMIRVVAY